MLSDCTDNTNRDRSVSLDRSSKAWAVISIQELLSFGTSLGLTTKSTNRPCMINPDIWALAAASDSVPLPEIHLHEGTETFAGPCHPVSNMLLQGIVGDWRHVPPNIEVGLRTASVDALNIVSVVPALR